MASCDPTMQVDKNGKEKKGRRYRPSCSHDLEESDGADEVVVVVKQQLLPNGFQPDKVNHCLNLHDINMLMSIKKAPDSSQ
jgi:hypothetical protein